MGDSEVSTTDLKTEECEGIVTEVTSDRPGDDQNTVSMGFVSPSSPTPPEVNGALELTASGPSGTSSEPSTVHSPTGGFQHPLSVAASAMLNVQQQSQVEDSHLLHQAHHQQPPIYHEYPDFKSGVAVSSADDQLHSPSHLVPAPELGLLLTGVETAVPVKREAEDLTSGAALRRSPDHHQHHHLQQQQQQRRLVSLEESQLSGCHSPSDTRFATPPHPQQLQQLVPLAISPRPLVYGSGHYSALSPGAVFVDTAPVSSVCHYAGSSNSTQLSSPPPPPQSLSQQQSQGQAPHSPTYSSVAVSGGGGGGDYYRDYYQLEPYPVTSSRSTLVYSTSDLGDPVVSGHVNQSSLPPPLQPSQQQQQQQQQHGLAFIGERFVSVSGVGGYKVAGPGLAMDLPSPDSGIGAEGGTPRDQTTLVHQGAVSYTDYSDMCGSANGLLPTDTGLIRPEMDGSPASTLSAMGRTTATRSWHDYGRQSEVDKIHIPKIYSNYGFRFFMESPISTSQRREDDRMTYVNKGQFYGITMEYVPDPDQPLKNMTVKSVILLVFREEKSLEDEMKAWQFWHSRQHSVKQRILDVDTKNSIGLVGSIEEVSHNAIAVYWNPLESSAKISIAVQCLSTDFSSQKGVKGLPLHIQIDTYEDYRDANSPVSHRAYVQIKSFCDKGAERKTRDEERRATKRKMTVTGRKKMEEMYHPASDRSEFYSMADTLKTPMLFQPSDDEPDRIGSLELQNYYSHGDTEQHMCVDSVPSANDSQTIGADACASPMAVKYQYSYPTGSDHDQPTDGSKDSSLLYTSAVKRARMSSPDNERVMLYVRQEQEQLFTPLHVVPPTTMGLLHAIASKYKVTSSCVQTLCRKNHKGVTAIMDDDMIQHYCNEDTFLLEIRQMEPDGPFDVTLVELSD